MLSRYKIIQKYQKVGNVKKWKEQTIEIVFAER